MEKYSSAEALDYALSVLNDAFVLTEKDADQALHVKLKYALDRIISIECQYQKENPNCDKQVFTIVALDSSAHLTGIVFTDGSVKIIDWRWEVEKCAMKCHSEIPKSVTPIEK